MIIQCTCIILSFAIVHEEQGTRPPDFLIDGLKALIKTLQNWTTDRQVDGTPL